MSAIRYRALLIGNGVFPGDPHNLPELRGPANDLRLLGDALKHPQVGLHAEADVVSLLDCARAEVLEAAESFFDGADRNDQLLFYYSGHGVLDRYRTLYLTARDTRTSHIISSGIADAVLNAMIRNSRSQRIVIVLDCCHSGRFKGAADVPEALRGEGRFVITSSRAQQLSDDAVDGDGPSAFTRFLVEALLSGDVDRDSDEFVSLNEVYNYILPRLSEATRQHPQRHYDQTVGELALGRCMRAATSRTAGAARQPGSAGGATAVAGGVTGADGRPGGAHDETAPRSVRPILAVSTDQITMDNVDPGETLREEIVDVFNQGGGTLEWQVHCDDDWLHVEPHKGFFKVRLSPRPGMNRGRIYVRAGDAGSRRIPVEVRVIEAPAPPCLTVSQDSVDFGTVPPGASAEAYTIRVINSGEGRLNPRIAAQPDWLDVRLMGELIQIRPLADRAGRLSGEVRVESDGGSATIRVTATVQAAPVLRVEPKRIVFDPDDDDDERTVRIRNTGGGSLEWSYEAHGDFFTVERTANGLRLTLDADEGRHRGSVFITSNAGTATIDVEAEVEWDVPQAADTGFGTDLNGTWNAHGVGCFVFAGSFPTYQYTEYNMLGIACGQGMAVVNGTNVQLHGHNILAGPVQGWLSVHGPALHGTVAVQGASMPLTLVRAGADTAGGALSNISMIR